ncbi:MAG TPA: nuclear transport factor 2 family protein [Mycobacterium sp.]|nr:nuclear transport factor 2 family protein [Mycobacterium sp.]
MKTTDAALRSALDEWQAGINAGDPQRVAAAFTDDAIFQGLRPYSVGRQGVEEYYGSQPPGMTVSYRILESRQPGPGVVLGYIRADFEFRGQAPIPLNIGVLVQHGPGGWRISHYQASRIG